MPTIKQSALAIITALEMQGCSVPLDYTSPLEPDQNIIVHNAYRELEGRKRIIQQYIEHSHVPLVDLYGNETTNNNVAADYNEILVLLKWYIDNDRIRYFEPQDAEAACGDHNGVIIDGCLEFNRQSTVTDDYIYLRADLIESSTSFLNLLVHETAHGFFGPHAEAVNDIIESGQLGVVDTGQRLQMSVKYNDPPYQYGEITGYGNALVDNTFNYRPFMNSEYNSIENRIEDGEITPQEGYDMLMEYFGTPEIFLERSASSLLNIDPGENRCDLWAIGLDEQDYVDSFENWPRYIHGYETLLDNRIRNLILTYPDEITAENKNRERKIKFR